MLAQALVQDQGQVLFQSVQADGPEWDVHVVFRAFDDQPGRCFGEAHQGRSRPGLQVDDLLSLTITWRSNGRLPVPILFVCPRMRYSFRTSVANEFVRLADGPSWKDYLPVCPPRVCVFARSRRVMRRVRLIGRSERGRD